MATRAAAITLHLAPPIFSWCESCMKSTAYTVRLYHFAGDEVILSGTVRGCSECDR